MRTIVPAEESLGEDRPAQRTRITLAALITVGAMYLVAQIVLIGFDRAPSIDESIYISQVSPDAHAAPFEAHRARGITFVIAPVVLLGGSATVLFIFLALVSSAMLVAAFHAWIPVLGWGAPVAAAVFGSLWVSLVYGSFAMPNLLCALLLVAAIGWLVRAASERAGRAHLVSLIWFAGAALIRPVEAVIALAAAAAMVALTTRAPRAVMWPLAGVLVGLIPWLIESAVRFGGPVARVRDAETLQNIYPGWNISQTLAIADGPFEGPAGAGPFTGEVLAWWVCMLVFAAVGMAAARTTDARRGATIATAAGAALTAPYLFFVGPTAARFLLPAYAMVSIGVAAGIVAVIGRASSVRTRAVATGLVAAIAVPWMGWHGATASRVPDRAFQRWQTLALLGEQIRTEAGSAACFVTTVGHSAPQIALAAGCASEWSRSLGGTDRATALQRRAEQGDRVFVLTGRVPPSDSAFASWTRTRVRAGYWLLEPPPRR